MSDKIKRAQALQSSKTSINSKNVKVEGFGDFVKQLQEITLANQTSHKELVSSINQLSKVILMAGEEGMDTSVIVDAINSLKEQMAVKARGPMLDYVVNFERDKNTGLMKSGIRMTAEPKKLH